MINTPTSIEFDAEAVKTRMQHLDRVLHAHALPKDKEMAIALLVTATHQLVQMQGPAWLSAFTALFIDIWRHMEVKIVTDIIEKVATEQVVEDLFKALSMKDQKTH